MYEVAIAKDELVNRRLRYTASHNGRSQLADQMENTRLSVEETADAVRWPNSVTYGGFEAVP